MINHSDFPLNIIWSQTFDWFFSARAAPLVDGESVVIRCGDYWVRLNVETGEEIARFLIHQRAGDGTFLLNQKQVLVTDFTRRPVRLSSLIAFDFEGNLKWCRDLEAIVGRGNVNLIDEKLAVLGVSPNSGQMLYFVDFEDGELLSSHNLDMGANAIIADREGYLVRNQTPTVNSYGLYRMDREISQYEPILQDPVWNVVVENQLFFIALRDANTNQFSVRVLDENFNSLWSMPCQSGAISLCNEKIFFIEQEEESHKLACRVTETGDLVWHSSVFREAIERIDIVGSYIFCRHMTGNYIFHWEDGSLKGSFLGNFASPTQRDGRIYLIGSQTAYCVES